jgi:hypothetical protein
LYQNSVNEFISSKKIGIDKVKKSSPPLPPTVLFKKKEKILHFKWGVFLLMSHLLSALLLTSPTPTQERKVLEVSKGYEILNLPVWNFSKIPPLGERVSVSLFNEEKKVTLSGFLRGIKDDSLGPTGKKAELEIKAKDLLKVRKAKGPWQIYPSITESHSSNNKKVYEVLL